MKSYPAAGCCYPWPAATARLRAPSDYAEESHVFQLRRLGAQRRAVRKTRTMPFNQELASGQLDEHAFRHYMIQDAHYLVAFGRALAVAAAKADNADGVVQFADAAKNAVVVERSLHDGFMKQFGISADTFNATPLTPASHHYTSYLIATAWSAPYPWPWPRCCLLLDLRRDRPRHPRPRRQAQPLQRLDRHLCRRGIPHPGPRSHRVRGPRRGTRVRRNGQGYARGIHTPRGWNGCSGIPRIGKAHGRSEPLKR